MAQSRSTRTLDIFNRVILTLLAVLGVGFFGIIASPDIIAGTDTGCETELLSSVQAPDGRTAAQIIEGDCGNAISTRFCISIWISDQTGQHKPHEIGRFKESNSDSGYRVSWDGNHRLVVQIPKAIAQTPKPKTYGRTSIVWLRVSEHRDRR